MTILIEGHSFGYELRRLARLFCEGEPLNVVTQGEDAERTEPVNPAEPLLRVTQEGERLSVSLRADGIERALSESVPADGAKLGLARLCYQLLSERTGLRPDWGILTGIRPVKLFRAALRAGEGEAELRERFQTRRFLSDSRFALALETARAEERSLKNLPDNSFSLYVSIPFCPTRCAYCSFVSHSVAQATKLLPDYLDCLCEELRQTGETARELGLRLHTVYFGGGTPTVLSAGELKRLTDEVARNFSMDSVEEYTVEAGRPDTITEEKLRVLRAAGVGRISINPQTLIDSVLEAIGRRHTAAQTLEAYALARKIGFDSINMDLIAGLPTDSLAGFCETVERTLALAPENLTVHTLTVKRGARLEFAQARAELLNVRDMVDYARVQTMQAGLSPYYLYRQAGTLCGLENVGYALPGKEGLYNMRSMDESHSLLAVGAGASTKLCRPSTGDLKRIYNLKYPYEYLSRFEEIHTHRAQIRAFYADWL